MIFYFILRKDFPMDEPPRRGTAQFCFYAVVKPTAIDGRLSITSSLCPFGARAPLHGKAPDIFPPIRIRC